MSRPSQTTLGEIAHFVNGDRGANYPSGDDFVANGIPFVSAADIAGGSIDLTGVKRITRESYERLRSGKTRANDVLFCLRGSLGKAGRVVESYEAAIASSLVIVRAREAVDPRFLYYVLQGPGVQGLMRALDNGSVQPNLSVREISKIAVPKLAEPEQRAIAQILGTLDDKIELARRMSETLMEIARALFKSWFVDFEPVRAKIEGRDPSLPESLADRFPARLVDSELGEIPEGWSAGTVSELCASIFSGGTPSTQEPAYWGGEIPWLSSGETRERVIISTERTITGSAVESSSTRLAPEGATVIAGAGQGNTRGQTSFLALDSYINQSVVALVAKRSPYHLFFDMERRYDEFRRVSDGHSSRGSLTTKLLAGLQALLPPDLIVDEFDHIVAPTVARVVELRRETETLGALRDYLLPRLIDGVLRVSPQHVIGNS